WIAEQTRDPAGGEPTHSNRIESLEDFLVAGALLKNRFPAQAGLSAFENQKLEQEPVVVNRHPPFRVVIGDPELGARPGAAHRRGHFGVLLAAFFFRGRRFPYVPRYTLPRRDLRSPLPMTAPYSRAACGAVRMGSSTLPVFRTPAGSNNRTSTSSSATVRCSTPCGTMSNSPGASSTERSRKSTRSRPRTTRKSSSSASWWCQTNSPWHLT